MLRRDRLHVFNFPYEVLKPMVEKVVVPQLHSLQIYYHTLLCGAGSKGCSFVFNTENEARVALLKLKKNPIVFEVEEGPLQDAAKVELACRLDRTEDEKKGGKLMSPLYQLVKPLVEPHKLLLQTDMRLRMLRVIHDESKQIKTIAKLVDDTKGMRYEMVATPKGLDASLLQQACKEATAAAAEQGLFA